MKTTLIIFLMLSSGQNIVARKIEYPDRESCITMSARINGDAATPMVAGCFFFNGASASLK